MLSVHLCVPSCEPSKQYQQEKLQVLPIINSIRNTSLGWGFHTCTTFIINAPIQGTAADIIKIAMIGIYNKLEKEGYKTKMLLQVHDELVFDVFKPELETIKKLIKLEMENAYELIVPLNVGIDVGENWLEAH